MSEEKFLQVSKVHKAYGSGDNRQEVLKGTDFSVAKGEFCVLLGPSGSGKSTLLNIIGGIDSADDGYIAINGDKLRDMDEKALTQYRRKHLGYVFQLYNLIPNLTVKENIEVGAYLSDRPLDIDELLKTLGLYNHRHKLPNQLSGGQQQRTSIGRAIVKNPDILLCDEPTGALDYNTSKEILKLIEDVNRKYGNTVIMVTHNEAIQHMADHTIKLRDGQVRKNIINENKISATDDAKIRVFVMRSEINRACLMSGEFPTAADEIAIDRMHADNHKISVGDTIRLNGKDMKVTGLVAFADYSTLYENNSDVMFDALTFNIAAVTREGYAALNAREAYQYAYQYTKRPANVNEQKEMSDKLVEQLAVLSLTGGMLDHADEAEELKTNVYSWTAYLEDVQAQADDIEARSKALQEKMAAMTPEEQFAAMEELQAETDAIQAAVEQLEAQSNKIDETVAHLEELKKYEEHVNELTDYVPEYANQAIHFAPEDMGSDKAMGEVLLIILVIVLAFIFAITESNTITNEAAVIGTLRSSGYTRWELLLHYITMPVLVTLLSAIIGNVLGYALFKSVVVAMYYNSYSLPTYVTLWNADAFVKTTLYPVLLMVIVNIIVVHRKLKISPLKFLRHDLSTSKRKKAVRLPKWNFLRRFRLRILFQNVTGYLTLFLGIFFVMVLLAFSVGMPATLSNYQEKATEYILADYQYVLKDTEDTDGDPITTSEQTAEQYSVNSLQTVDGVHVGEDVTVYGYIDGSRYFKLPYNLQNGQAYISEAYADKFSLQNGQKITLKEKYTDKSYDFTVTGVYDLPGTIAVFLPNDVFNETFGLDAGSYTGFLSEHQITDIDDNVVVSVITVDDALKMAKQLDHSMGDYMTYFSVICMLVAMLIIFLLTKLIIERNTVSISMVKVLGYDSREINSLYVRLTTVVVVISSVLTAFLSVVAVRELWKQIMYEMSGWFTFYIGAKEIVQIIVMVIIAYLVVALMDMRRIRRIPMTEALKNVE